MPQWEYKEMHVIYNYYATKRFNYSSRSLYISQIDGLDLQKENERRWNLRDALKNLSGEDDFQNFDVISRLNEFGRKGWELVTMPTRCAMSALRKAKIQVQKQL